MLANCVGDKFTRANKHHDDCTSRRTMQDLSWLRRQCLNLAGKDRLQNTCTWNADRPRMTCRPNCRFLRPKEVTCVGLLIVVATFECLSTMKNTTTPAHLVLVLGAAFSCSAAYACGSSRQLGMAVCYARILDQHGGHRLWNLNDLTSIAFFASLFRNTCILQVSYVDHGRVPFRMWGHNTLCLLKTKR